MTHPTPTSVPPADGRPGANPPGARPAPTLSPGHQYYCAMRFDGMDTFAIAKQYGVTEAEVYNAIGRYRQWRRA